LPFSSISNPIDLARAHAAFETAWTQIVNENPGQLLDANDERGRLARIVADQIPFAEDEDDLARRAVKRFLEGRPGR
jgi:hypothetical protein